MHALRHVGPRLLVLASIAWPSCISLKDGADRGPADGGGDMVTSDLPLDAALDADASALDADASAPDADAAALDADASALDADAPAPDADAAAPDADASPPDADASAPDADASAPDADASPPDADASPPDADASAPDADASAPDADASPPDADASAPDADASPPDAAPCPTGTTRCGGACVALASDVAHCGACGALCTSGLCEAGVCVRALDLAMGPVHTCAAMSDGSVRCWGSNSRGQLGDGTFLARPAPITLAGLSATQVAAAGEHTCARLTDGSIRCWGANMAGQLGAGDVTTASPSPRPVGGITTAAEVTAGQFHACARLADGTVACWGHYLQVGTMSPAGCSGEACASQRPVGALAGVLGLSAGAAFTLARMMDGGAVRRWGIEPPTGLMFPSPAPIGGLSGVLDVSAGERHACVLLSDRTVRCWGSGAMGQLGSGDTRDYGSGDPAAVVGLTDVTQLAAGQYHTCARRGDGGVWCWGNLPGASLTAGPVGGLGGVVEVASGSRSACARLTGGGVRCWGNNDFGQLGDGTLVTRTTPVAVAWR